MWCHLELGPLRDHESWASLNGIIALIRKDMGDMISLCLCIWAYSKSVSLCKPGRTSPRTQPWWHLDLRFPASKSVRNKFLLCKPPSLCYMLYSQLELRHYSFLPQKKRKSWFSVKFKHEKLDPSKWVKVVRLGTTHRRIKWERT